MATITFDGDSKIIDVGYDADTTTVTAVEIYSRWKEWVQNGNAQYDEAFGLSVGGNDLGGGSSLDGYYFLRNDLGWRIRAADVDHKLVINGQLFGFASATAIALSRPGRTIVYEYTLSSRSQVVNPSADAATAASSFQGGVWFDPMSAFGGTQFPTGTSVEPVNSLSNAVSIALKYGLRSIYILGSTTVTTDISGYNLRGAGTDGDIILDPSATTLNTSFDGLNVMGDATDVATISNTTLTGHIENFSGTFTECTFADHVDVIGDVIVSNCTSGVPGAGQPYFDCSTAGIHSIQVREWVGGIELRGFAAGSVGSFDFHSGRLNINADCTGGTIKVRGVGEPIVDNSGGAVTLDTDGFLSKPGLINPIVANIWAAND